MKKLQIFLGFLVVHFAATICVPLYAQLASEEIELFDNLIKRWEKETYYSSTTTPLSEKEKAVCDKLEKLQDELSDAACDGNIASAEDALNRGAKINPYNFFSDRHPLFSAAMFARKEMITFLYRKGAEINFEDYLEGTPLHIAVRSLPSYGTREELTIKLEIIDLLISLGANVNAKDSYGRTPLFYCVDWTEAYGLLISRGADPNIKDNKGFTAFDVISAEIRKKKMEGYKRWFRENFPKIWNIFY